MNSRWICVVLIVVVFIYIPHRSLEDCHLWSSFSFWEFERVNKIRLLFASIVWRPWWPSIPLNVVPPPWIPSLGSLRIRAQSVPILDLFNSPPTRKLRPTACVIVDPSIKDRRFLVTYYFQKVIFTLTWSSNLGVLILNLRPLLETVIRKTIWTSSTARTAVCFSDASVRRLLDLGSCRQLRDRNYNRRNAMSCTRCHEYTGSCS